VAPLQRCARAQDVQLFGPLPGPAVRRLVDGPLSLMSRNILKPIPPASPARRRLVAAGLALGVALAAGGLLAGCSEKAPSFKSTDITGADYGKSLTLTNASTGQPVSLEDFR